MINESAQEQTSTLRFRREVADRFGVLPNFFCSADAAPGLAEELWKFAKSAYLDSPLPSLVQGAAVRPSLAILRGPLLHCPARRLSHRSGPAGRRRRRGARDGRAGDRDVAAAPPRGPGVHGGPRAPRAWVPERSIAGASQRGRDRSLRRADDHVLVATRRRPRTQSRSRGGWRRHVRTPGRLSRLRSYGALLDRDAPGADV